MNAADLWPAPLATEPLDATVVVPGSKSLTNRYLPLAALADGTTRITGALRSRDADLMIAALQALGATVVTSADPTTLTIEPGPLRGDVTIDCGLAGTVMRFIPPIAALADGPVHLDGDIGARSRPMGPVLTALRDLGVQVTAADPEHLPATVHGSGQVHGGELQVDAGASSQFISALLLAAPRFTTGLTLRHVGEVLPSKPHIDMTVDVLRDRGVQVNDSEPNLWRVEPGPIKAGTVVVEPDLSNAAPFLAAALVAGGTVRVPNWPTHTTQPGALLPQFLTAFGGAVGQEGDVLHARGTGDLTPVDMDLSAAGELAPTMAALAALAPGRSHLRGIAHLRGHETDRPAASTTEIRRLGGGAQETEDGLIIDGGGLRPAVLQTYHDHRMATFAAIIGLVVEGVQVVDVGTTAKTLPGFATMWQRMLREGT